MNDFLDYVSIVVTLVLPALLGPGLLLCLSPLHLLRPVSLISDLRRPSLSWLAGS